MTHNVFSSLTQVFDLIYSAFGALYSFFTERIGTLITTYLDWLPFGLDELVDDFLLGIEGFLGVDISIITFMLGVGLPVFLVLTLVKWILDILP